MDNLYSCCFSASPYTAVYAGGSVTVAVNKQSGGGAWKKIASSRPFLPGTTGYVQLANGTGETSLNVMADAAWFTYASATPAPTIFAHPQSQTVCQGAVAIPSATGTAFSLSSATTGDAGSYDVVVTNACGPVTSATAMLTVNLPSPPVLGYTCNGSTLILTWTNGVLEQARILTPPPGIWSDVSGATSPYAISLPSTNAMTFYRLRN